MLGRNGASPARRGQSLKPVVPEKKKYKTGKNSTFAMQDLNLSVRVLKMGVWTLSLTTFALFEMQKLTWATGFALGSALSLFSLLSLAIVVPLLFQPGMPRYVTALLGVTLLMKLPLYCGAFYLTATGHFLCPGAVFAGLLLAPVLITLKTIGGMIPLPTPAPKAMPQTLAAAPRRRRIVRRIRAAFAAQKG